MNVDIGGHVSEDQSRLQIDAPELANDVTRCEAGVAKAEAEYEQAEASVVAATAKLRSAESLVAGVEAGVLRATAKADQVEAEYARLKELSARGTVNLKLVEVAMNAFRAARASSLSAMSIRATSSSRA